MDTQEENSVQSTHGEKKYFDYVKQLESSQSITDAILANSFLTVSMVEEKYFTHIKQEPGFSQLLIDEENTTNINGPDFQGI